MSQPASQTINLGFRPHKYQRELIQALRKHRFGVAVTHRRWGKTRMAVQLLLHTALTCPHPRPRCAYISPLLSQAKQSAWLYLTDVASKIPGHRILESELAVELPGDRRVKLFGGSQGNEEAIRGIYLNGCVIDEYADVAPHLLDQIVMPTLADYQGWLLVIGTPKGMDAFSALYHTVAPARGWYTAMYRADETLGEIPALSREEYEEQKRNMTPLAWRQEMLCDFGAAAEDALITIDLASASAARHYVEAQFGFAPVVIGVDVARYGEDRSVIFRRQGLYAGPHEVYEQIDNMTLAGKVGEWIDKHKAQAVFVDAGRGEGVIDRLRQLGYRVTEVNFGGRPIDERYADKRTEIWHKLKEWMEQGGAIPNDSALKTDLCGPTYSFTSAGKVKLEAKDDMRKRGMRSTDLGDGLALTFAMPVQAIGGRGGRRIDLAMSDG